MIFDLSKFKKADLSSTMISGNGDIQPVIKINDHQITFNRTFELAALVSAPSRHEAALLLGRDDKHEQAYVNVVELSSSEAWQIIKTHDIGLDLETLLKMFDEKRIIMRNEYL